MANNSIKILVVDDLQDNLITLNALIKDAFPEAITLNAQSGEKGLELAAKEDPDVILLDIIMPGMDGYEVCKKLKVDKELSDIPVAFVTAIENTKEALIQALDSGGEAFLTKPIDEIELTAQIRAMLKIKEANNAKKDEKIRLEKLVEERSKELVQELEARKQAEKNLKVNEATVRKKLEAILEPEGDVSSLELSDIIDAEMLQSIMDDFYRLTGMLGAVLDVSGKVLVSVGWQDICTKFHRCHPDTLENCFESDTVLTKGVAEGEFMSYRCKNNMWDIVTPIMIGGKHLGNVFMGQYFLEGEELDIELFRKQAKKYGFDEAAYMAALERVPCFSKETVEKGMQFYSKLAKIISTLSYSSIQQSRMLAQQKQAEEKLRKSEENFRGIYEQSPIAIEIYNEDGKLIDINQQTLDMFGLDDKKHVLGFDLWADPNLSDEKMKSLKRGQEIFLSTEFDFEIVKENKLYPTSRSGKIYMDMYAIPLLNEKQITGYLVQIVEVTRRKQAEETIKESQNLLQQAETISNQGSWKWDVINDVWSFSENWLKIHGFEHSGISREELMKIAHPDDNSKIDIAFENALSDNKAYSIEHRIIRKDNGAVRYIKAAGEVHFLDNGKPDYMIGIAQDTTEHKQAEEELKNAKEKAEESNRLKTEFLNNMSHEVRTPMNGIIGFSEMLAKPDLSEEKRKYYSKIVRNSSRQLLRIIDDILAISTLETKQVKLNETEFCLNDFLMELFSVFNLQSKGRNIPLYLKKGLQSQHNYIVTDKTKLNIILSNLLENALRFTNEGFIEFGYYLEKTNLILYVQDTGIGVSPKNHKIIFERFSQEEKEISHQYGGLGLGLSISKENAQLLGGDLTLESEKGKGSTFYVTIPYKPVQEADNNTSNSIDSKLEPHNNYTILVAEDEEVNCLYIEVLFEDVIDGSYYLIHAKNGKEAVEICMENNNIDLVLMDIKMPIMNGHEAADKIKEKFPYLPIIAQTAYSTESDKQLALNHGCDDFISKPLNGELLASKIRALLK